MPVTSTQVDLLRVINRGNCLLFAGSGLSSALGLISWKALAEKVFGQIKSSVQGADINSYAKFLSRGQYPQLFGQAAADLGGKEQLIDLLRTFLPTSYAARPDSLYSLLTSWPFVGYVTTNWDDFLSAHLKYHKKNHRLLTNSVTDSQSIDASTGQFVWKLHGDLTRPETVIATESDYQAITVNPNFEICRKKLLALFQMYDVLIVGHSLTDFNVQLLLQTTQLCRDPRKPIYLIAANQSHGEIRSNGQQFGVSTITYDNSQDGRHLLLHRRLSQMDRFIGSEASVVHTTQVSDDKAAAATSLYIVRALRNAEKGGSVDRKDCISPLVLQRLAEEGGAPVKQSDLFTRQPLQALAATSVNSNRLIDETLSSLEHQRLVQRVAGGIKISSAGLEKVDGVRRERTKTRTEALQDFQDQVLTQAPDIAPETMQKMETFIDNLLVDIFSKRGLAVVNSSLLAKEAGGQDLVSFFEEIEHHSLGIENEQERDAFIEAGHDFLLSPTNAQQKYTEALAQGFFLYYLSSQDTSTGKIAHDFLLNCAWIVDASVLIPLLAIDGVAHQATAELFALAHKVGMKIVTTPKLRDEVIEHLDWAIKFEATHNATDVEFLQASLSEDGYKQNVFIDGFIRWSCGGSGGTFKDYLRKVWRGVKTGGMDELLRVVGCKVIDRGTIDETVKKNAQAFKDIAVKIKNERESRDTYTSSIQVNAEAEVGLIIRSIHSGLPGRKAELNVERAYFLSGSKVLDRSVTDRTITWTPFALCQVLATVVSSASPVLKMADLLLSEIYFAGVSLIDRKKYVKFFGPAIEQSKIDFEEQKAAFIEDLEDDAAVVDDYFNRLDDLKKPQFTSQMAWKVARDQELEVRKLRQEKSDLESTKKALEKDLSRNKNDKQERQIAQLQNRVRNLEDPRRLEKVMRKAKNRRKKAR